MSDTVSGIANDTDDMHNIHSFVVRVWLETSGTETDEEIWRGHIIHLPGDERHYFSNINEIPRFIESHLKRQQ